MRRAITSLLLMSVLGGALGSAQFDRRAVARVPLAPTQAITHMTPAPFGGFTEDLFGVKLELARMPSGTFLMGNDQSPNPEEKPAHQVNLRSFHIGQYEITRQQWNLAVDSLPKVSRDLRRQYVGPGISWNFEETTPADAILWDDAVEFCDRLTKFTGKRYRLPSEAEWEYACRAGTRTEFSFGDEVNYNLAHFRNAAAGDPSYWLLPVGRKGYVNAWGLYDMHGNVAEWCLDVEHPNYIGAPTDGSAWTQGGDQEGRRLRGGMYSLRSEFGRSSARYLWSKSVTVSGLGFRVVAEVNPMVGTGQVTAVSAANYVSTSLAVESVVAIFGANLSNATQTAQSTPLPQTLAGASIVIKDSRGNELLAPLFFVSPSQINLQIPSNIALGAATISVVTNGTIGSTGAVELTNVSPGLFSADASGKGLPAALALRVKSNGEQVYEPVAQFDQTTKQFVAVPIDLGNPADQVFLLLFGTGFRNRSSLAAVTASVGGVGAQVTFAGAQGGLVGLDQCNLRLSSSLAGRGEVDINLTVDGKTANRVNIRVK